MLNQSPLAKVSLIATALLMGLTVACAPGLAVPASEEVDITGTWKADAATPDGELEVFMKISRSAQGTYRAVLDIPVMESYDLPILFTYENGMIHWLMDEFGAVFDGTLTDAGTIAGTVSISGESENPLVFHRLEE